MTSVTTFTTGSEILRPHESSFTPSMWGDFFLSFSVDNQEWERRAQEVELMKGQVRKWIITAFRKSKVADKFVLIDTLERLGVSYHFEEEIEEQLEQMFNLMTSDYVGEVDDFDLYNIALQFRLFRQHGYKMPCDTLKKFKDENNGFKETLKGDLEGLLSLYEASHLRTHGEDILEEALSFTTTYLKLIVPHLSSPLQEKVLSALEQPMHKRLTRLEAPQYIANYSKEESRNLLLLNFSKLDFNFVQMLHKKELCEISRWWKELDLLSKYSYARDRAIECYFWGLGVSFEPQYSVGRIVTAKVLSLLSIVDDTYDSYGTLEELQIFTKAIQRWDSSAINELPTYMKPCYRALLDLYNGLEEQFQKEGRSYAAYHTKERMKELSRTYLAEAKWLSGQNSQPFSEYLDKGIITSTYYLMSAAAFTGMNSAKVEIYNWHSSNPKMLKAACIIGRLRNDVASYERESKSEDNTLAIHWYMKEHEVSVEEAQEKFLEFCENAWRDMNDEILRPTAVPWHILISVLNIARFTDLSYLQNKDGYSFPERVIKRQMLQTLVNPIVI